MYTTKVWIEDKNKKEIQIMPKNTRAMRIFALIAVLVGIASIVGITIYKRTLTDPKMIMRANYALIILALVFFDIFLIMMLSILKRKKAQMENFFAIKRIAKEVSFEIKNNKILLDGEPMKIVYEKMGEEIVLFNYHGKRLWIMQPEVTDFRKMLIDNNIK